MGFQEVVLPVRILDKLENAKAIVFESDPNLWWIYPDKQGEVWSRVGKIKIGEDYLVILGKEALHQI